MGVRPITTTCRSRRCFSRGSTRTRRTREASWIPASTTLSSSTGSPRNFSWTRSAGATRQGFTPFDMSLGYRSCFLLACLHTRCILPQFLCWGEGGSRRCVGGDFVDPWVSSLPPSLAGCYLPVRFYSIFFEVTAALLVPTAVALRTKARVAKGTCTVSGASRCKRSYPGTVISSPRVLVPRANKLDAWNRLNPLELHPGFLGENSWKVG